MSDAVLRFIGQESGLAAQFARANAGLTSMSAQATRTSEAINKGFKNAGIVVAALAFTRVTKELFDFNEELLKSAGSVGVTVESMQRLQFIASQSETSVESITGSIIKFQTLLGQGNDKTIASLSRLGISLTEINSLSPDEQFLTIAKALAEIHSPAEQDAIAMNLFGKSFKELLPLLKLGADGIDAVDAQFDEFGITISTETVQKVDAAGDALGRMSGAVKSLGVELLSLPHGVIESTADGITLFFKAVAFGLRGEGGGHGENPIANLTQDIDLLQQRVNLLRNTAENGGVLGPDALEQLIKFEAALDRLKFKQDVLTGTGIGGISPLKRVAVDIDSINIPKNALDAVNKVDLGKEFDSAEQKRLRAGDINNPIVQGAKDDNEVLLQLNQEKVDALLEQETKGVIQRTALATQANSVIFDITKVFGEQLVDLDAIKNDSIANNNQALVGILGGTLTNLFGQNKNYQIALATIETLSGAARALADFPYPYSLAVAGLVLSAGFARVQQIRSVSHKHGGGSLSGSGGGGSIAGTAAAPAAPALDTDQAASQSVLQVYINGPIAGPDAARWLIDELKELVDGRDVVVFSGKSAQAQIIRQGG